MTTIKIEPISTKSRGGFDVELTGINLGTTDLLRGTITTQTRTWQGSWDENGTCRDNDSQCNLDTSDSDIEEVIRDAKDLVKQ